MVVCDDVCVVVTVVVAGVVTVVVGVDVAVVVTVVVGDVEVMDVVGVDVRVVVGVEVMVVVGVDVIVVVGAYETVGRRKSRFDRAQKWNECSVNIVHHLCTICVTRFVQSGSRHWNTFLFGR